MSGAEPIIQMRGIVKQFPGVVANEHVDLDLWPGEILALLGENGAGKTTLMNVLYGLQQPDEGEVLIDGKPVRLGSPREAIAHGIGMVHQHFMLVPTLTVEENVTLGAETTHGLGLLDLGQARRRVRELSESYRMQIYPGALVRDLPVGVQQRVEILRALYRGARILILDEPTAVLAPQETQDLFGVLRKLARDGTGIVFITHKLHEVFEVADRIVVLRQGRVVGSLLPGEASEASLAAMMVGRPVVLRVEKHPATPKNVVLRIEDLQVHSERRLPAVDGLSLEVRAGEIVGIAGVEGNGQTELVEALTGLRPPAAGRIELAGREVTHADPADLIYAGAAHVPEDRHKNGLVLSFPIADNLVLRTYDRPPFSRGLRVLREAILGVARRLVQEFDIRTRSVTAPASTLSGGNQQKVVVARELSRKARLLVAAQPTRGLDVGSTEFIHRKLVEVRDAGLAIVLVSAELDEIMSLSDRIAVMYRGRIVDVLRADEATPELLGLMMTTGKPRAQLASQAV
jgi:ABC-type uncharacterized transport system ATPase subunit